MARLRHALTREERKHCPHGKPPVKVIRPCSWSTSVCVTRRAACGLAWGRARVQCFIGTAGLYPSGMSRVSGPWRWCSYCEALRATHGSSSASGLRRCGGCGRDGHEEDATTLHPNDSATMCWATHCSATHCSEGASRPASWSFPSARHETVVAAPPCSSLRGSVVVDARNHLLVASHPDHEAGSTRSIACAGFLHQVFPP
jgi:hypothetical protein